MTPERELLDQLSNTSLPYFIIERLIFGGDRHHALNTIVALVREGKLRITQAGTDVPIWKAQQWASNINDPATVAALGAATVDITGAGLDDYLQN